MHLRRSEWMFSTQKLDYEMSMFEVYMLTEIWSRRKPCVGNEETSRAI